MKARSLPVVARCALALGLLCVPAAATAQVSQSGPLARELSKLLESAKLDSIAAPDPTTGGFVAAMYVPGTQLLVVSGKFASAEIGPYRISKKEFRELYMDLMGGALAGSKVVASDVSADGLVSKPPNNFPPDTWERGDKNFAFAGARKAKLKDEDYTKAFSEADTEYARMLTLLIEQARAKSGN